MKKINIKSFILQEDESTEEISEEEFQKLPKISKKKQDEETAAIRVPQLRIDMDTQIVGVSVADEDFKRLCHVFKLYKIPLKPIKGGIEIDIRDKENYPYRDKMPEP